MKEFRSALDRHIQEARSRESKRGEAAGFHTRSIHEIVWIGLRIDRGNQFPLLLLGYTQLLEIKASLKLH